MTQTDLFVEAHRQEWRWYLLGKCLAWENRGWPQQRLHRIVHYFQNDCIASTEEEARSIFEKQHGPVTKHNKWKFMKGEEIQADPPRGKGRTKGERHV